MDSIKQKLRLREVGWAAAASVGLAWAAGAEPMDGPPLLPPPGVLERSPAAASDAPPSPAAAVPQPPPLPPARTLVLQPLPTVVPAIARQPLRASGLPQVSPAQALELTLPQSVRPLASFASTPTANSPMPVAARFVFQPAEAQESAADRRAPVELSQPASSLPLPPPAVPAASPSADSPPPLSDAAAPAAEGAQGEAALGVPPSRSTPSEPAASEAADLPAVDLTAPEPLPSEVAADAAPGFTSRGLAEPTVTLSPPARGLPVGPGGCCLPGDMTGGPGDQGCCSAGAGCHENPAVSFPSTVHGDLLELLAVDIARRSLLAIHPYAAKRPIVTLDVVVRRAGHDVHTYARLQWTRRHWWQGENQVKTYESEVSATLLYHPDKRLIYDISYVDNGWLPFRNIDMSSQVVASYNEDFALRDKTGLPPTLLSDRVDVLEPYIKPRFLNRGPIEEPDPRAKSLRTVRRDSNVTANQ